MCAYALYESCNHGGLGTVMYTSNPPRAHTNMCLCGFARILSLSVQLSYMLLQGARKITASGVQQVVLQRKKAKIMSLSTNLAWSFYTDVVSIKIKRKLQGGFSWQCMHVCIHAHTKTHIHKRARARTRTERERERERDGRTIGRTDGRTDGRTHARTHACTRIALLK